jgi:hypothetical protein
MEKYIVKREQTILIDDQKMILEKDDIIVSGNNKLDESFNPGAIAPLIKTYHNDTLGLAADLVMAMQVAGYTSNQIRMIGKTISAGVEG